MVNTEIKADFQVLHFQSQGVHFCADLNCIKKFLPLMQLEPIPGSLKHVAGLMNVAGRGIPVIDFAICLGLQRTSPYSLDTPILLCKNNEDEMGIIIDGVIGLDHVEKKSLQMQDKFDDSKSPFLATVVLRDNLAILVDMSEIIKSNLMTNAPNFILDNDLLNKMRSEI
jgi:purine-binding chemotaxis protein CheW